jgi:hypothetical protein
VGKERVALEYEARIALPRRLSRDVMAAQADLARRRCDEPGDHAQRRRLAAARRPQQHDELALRNVEVDARDRPEIAVRLGEAGKLEASHGCGSATARA